MALSFLNSSPCTWTMSLDPSWVTYPCFHLLSATFFMFGFCQAFLVHPRRPLANITWLPAHQVGPLWSLEEEILENQAAFLDPYSLQGHIPWDPSKQVHEQEKACSHEDHCCDPAFCLVSSLQGPELFCFMITAAKTVPSLQIPNPFFLVSKHLVQQSVFLCWFIDHLCRKWISFSLQFTPFSFMMLYLLRKACKAKLAGS